MDNRRKSKKGKTKQPSRNTSWSVFPSDVEDNILSRLPASSLIRLRCVCKHWYNIITKPHFVKMQLNRSTLTEEGSRLAFALCGDLYSFDVEAYGKKYIKTRPYKKNYMQTERIVDLSFIDNCSMSFRILGSCNGLLLLAGFDKSLYLLNPVTKEYKKLPFPEIHSRIPTYNFTAFGFGYSPRTDEYKVVMIRSHMIEQSAPADVGVYTLGTNSSWRIIRGISYRIMGSHYASVNGSLHWIASGMPGFSPVAISFDFGDENFRELSLPKSITQEDTNNIPIELVELGGFLSLYHCCKADRNFYIWIMKDYGDEHSWSKQFSVTVSIFPGYSYCPTPTPLCILKKDEVMLYESDLGSFVLDMVNKEIFHLEHLRTFPSDFGLSKMYVESLVSLKTGDGTDVSDEAIGL